MNPTEHPIGVAGPRDRERVVQIAVAAFRSDPFLRLMLPDDDEYAESAPEFFGALFDRRIGAGTVWMAGDAAISMWDGPGAPTETLFRLPDTARAVLEEYDAAVHGLLPTGRHWYLGVLATDPAHSGRKLGRAVMRAGMDRAAADGLPAYLETTNPANVALYERAGWQVQDHLELPLPVWLMRRDPI